MALLVAGAPTIVDPGGLNAFLPSKVLVVGVALVALVVVTPPRLPALPRWALGAGAVLTIWLVLATALSDAPVTALLGAPTRLLGLVGWAGFAVAVCAGAAAGQRLGVPGTLLLVARWSAVPVVVGGLVAVLELAGSPPVASTLSFEGRVLGLFGSPALTAGLLALQLPLAAAASLRDRGWAWVHRTTVAVGLATLVVTGSRAALVATVLGLVVLAALHLDVAARVRSRGALAGVAVLVLGLVTVVTLAGTGRLGSAPATLEGRVDTWAVALRVVTDAPVTGVGPEGFGAAFVTEVDEGFVRRWSRDQLTDRAHNVVLDVTAVGGVPSGAAFVVLLAGVATVAARRGRADLLVAGGGIALAAVVLQQQVLFLQPVHDSLWWFLAGVLTAPSGPRGADGRASTAGRAAAGLLALSVAATGLAATVADRTAAAAYRAPSTGVAVAEAAVRRFPAGELYGLVLADRALAAGDARAPTTALPVLEEVEARAFPTGLVTLARVDLLQRRHQRSPGGDGAALAAARLLLEELLDRDPTNGDAWLKLGVVALEEGDRDEAVASWRRAEVLLPGRDEPRTNLEAVGAAGRATE